MWIYCMLAKEHDIYFKYVYTVHPDLLSVASETNDEKDRFFWTSYLSRTCWIDLLFLKRMLANYAQAHSVASKCALPCKCNYLYTELETQWMFKMNWFTSRTSNEFESLPRWAASLLCVYNSSLRYWPSRSLKSLIGKLI